MELTIEELESKVGHGTEVHQPPKFTRSLDELDFNKREPYEERRNYKAIVDRLVAEHLDKPLKPSRIDEMCDCDTSGRHNVVIALRRNMKKRGYNIRYSKKSDSYHVFKMRGA